MSYPTKISLSLFVLISAILISSAHSANAAQVINPYGNPNTIKALEDEKRRQLQAAQSWKIFHDFQFDDRFDQSGIKFEHHPVEDACKNYMAVHYDHGNGIAVADVDGDGKLDVYLVNQLGGNQLYRNLGGGKFEDITSQAGIGLSDKICVTASFADIDNDGKPDLVVTTVRMGNYLFKNLGGGKFADITGESGLNTAKRAKESSGAVFFDFNNDGLLDLFICNVGSYTVEQKGPGGFYHGRRDAFSGWRYPLRLEESVLYQNMGGGKFKDVSKEMGLEHKGWSGDATVCDVNGDGYPDLYVLSMSGDDKLYINDHGKRFVENTAQYFPKTPWGAMGVKFFDWNNDGLMDLYVTDMHSDMTGAQIKAGDNDFTAKFEKAKSDPWCAVEWTPAALRGASNNILGNAFYENKGGGKFEEISQKIGVETYWPWGFTVADLNADGFEDVFVAAGMGYPLRYSKNSVLLNENGQRFVDGEFVVGVEPRKNNRIDKEAFTLDCSGEDKKHYLCQGKAGLVTVLGSTSSRSSAAFDLDDDGDLDLITNEWNDHPMVLISNLAEKKKIHFAKIKLVGTTSNRDAIGATVKVHAGGKTFTRYNDGKSGYLSQSSMPLYFGLGDAEKIESVEITWPSGKKQTANVGMNAATTITEDR
jgi:hypothetical protein